MAGMAATNPEYTGLPTSDPGLPKGAYAGAYIGPGRERAVYEFNNSHVAAGKAISILLKMETIGYCGVEKASVYGAALAIPQIARSVDWSATMVGLAMRSYLFMLFNVFLQVVILAVIDAQAHVMSPYKGRMHLCDFGASIFDCHPVTSSTGGPGGPNCLGPGGTTYTFSRLYDFETWNTRAFVRDALMALFPDREEDINIVADPGEYGLQDYYCRIVCCLIFMVVVVDDFKGTLAILRLIYNVPNRADTWIKYEVPDWAESKEQAKRIHGWTELSLVKFRVAGMPVEWKVCNFFLVLLPKFLIWCVLLTSGFHCLMETAGIMDQVVNCMALIFVLRIDEGVLSKLSTVLSRHIMDSIEDWPLFSIAQEESESDSAVLERFRKDEFVNRCRTILTRTLPWKLISIVLLTGIFLLKYYNYNCTQSRDGSWVSNPILLPKSVVSTIPTYFRGIVEELLGIQLEDVYDQPRWAMPAQRWGGSPDTDSHGDVLRDLH